MEKRVYIIVRKDLNLRRGKEIAQACHAVIGLGVEDMPMITLQADSESSLLALQTAATVALVRSYLVRDAGRTEVEPNTPTVLAVGPVAKGEIPAIDELRLY